MKSSCLATIATAILTATLCGARPASAQDFGGMLGRLAERTAERAARNAADGLTRPRPEADRSRPARPAEDAPNAASPAPVASQIIPAPPGVEPWPINAGHRAVVRPNQLAFSPDMIAQKARFAEASTFACSTCEGSVEIDSWRKFIHPEQDTYSQWSALISAWTVGRVIEWRGVHVDGRITVLSEVPVGDFHCRQLRHRITTRGPNPVVTERPGLICIGKQDQYSSAETWHQVF